MQTLPTLCVCVVKSANLTFAYKISDDEQVHVTDNPKKKLSYCSVTIVLFVKRNHNHEQA